MSYPPIFDVCSADSQVQNVFGGTTLRVYLFGQAPQNPTMPYAVWQRTGGAPENCISDVPDLDLFTLQVDIYADLATDAREGAEALRDAIEPEAHIVSWIGESRDPATRHYRVTFLVDWHVSR